MAAATYVQMVAHKDIMSRIDLELLIGSFYKELLLDKEMHHIFLEVAKIDLEAHLPILVDFWEGVLFQKWNYTSDVMGKHLALNKLHPIERRHFDAWLATFQKVLGENFKGSNADQVWNRANSIASIMKIKLGVIAKDS